jgi:porin
MRRTASTHMSTLPVSLGGRLSLMLLAWVAIGPVAAQEAKTLTGDWGGVRSQLVDQGITLTTIYTSEAANNPRGGDEQKTAYADEWAFGGTFDLHKLFGWQAGNFQMTVTDRNGHDLDETANLHTLMQVQEVYGRGQTWRLSELWYQQRWLDNRFIWKVGRVTPGKTFGSFSCHFENLTFCGSQPGSVRGDYWYNYPVSQWGTSLDFHISEQFALSLGIYQVNPTYIDDSWAVHYGLLPNNPAGTTGALIPLELDWTPQFLGLPDTFQFGAWYDTSNANDVYFDVNRQPLVVTGDEPLRRHGRDGVYLSFEQQISGVASDQGAQLFLNITQADRATSPLLDRQIALGVQYKGPFAGRPNDVMGFAAGTSHVNSRVAADERLLDEIAGENIPVQSSEYVAEIFYGWTPWPYITLRPNVQYVLHPGGSNAYENDVVIGLKTTIKF